MALPNVDHVPPACTYVWRAAAQQHDAAAAIRAASFCVVGGR
jgi:hypothetical protein